MNALDVIADGGKYDLANRFQRLLFGIFNYAISRQWMDVGTNPAMKLSGDESPEPNANHHPSIHWDDVPELLTDVQLNKSSTNVQAVAATKLLLMTFLRSLPVPHWSVLNESNGCHPVWHDAPMP